MTKINNNFENIGFEDFKKLAIDDTLSKYERIGFPDSYRSGKEEEIFHDILQKLTVLKKKNQNILDIGPGCSDLPKLLINHCRTNQHTLTLIDSSEMLNHLPDDSHVRKVSAMYPNCSEVLADLEGKVDAILCYSVLQYILIDASFFRFLDKSLSLLAPGGQFLIGDIPNVSMRKRFFSSETGIRFHQEFMKTTEKPRVIFNKIEHDNIDDSIVFALLQRARSQGFDSYIIPQNPKLPMANRREDILIIRP